MRTLDFHTYAAIEFNNANAELLGGEGAGWAAMENLLDRAVFQFAWEQVGLTDAALNQARDYAMGRYAFGRSIASYQAPSTNWRACTLRTLWPAVIVITVPGRTAAARTCPGSSHGSGWIHSSVGTCRRRNVQTHGGMGFTWEFDCQFYYRRAAIERKHWQRGLLRIV